MSLLSDGHIECGYCEGAGTVCCDECNGSGEVLDPDQETDEGL